MKIAVLNGSPKGMISVTMQYVHYLEQELPQHEWKIINVASTVQHLEKNEDAFNGALEEIRKADAVLWGFPLYYMLVCSQMKRFIELVFERGAENAFRGKYAAALMTSIHFFDHTAKNYIHAVSEDLGMKFTLACTPAMYDLMNKKERKDILAFGKEFIETVEKKEPVNRVYYPAVKNNFAYKPKQAGAVITSSKKIVMVKDGDSANLDAMVRRFSGNFSANIEVVDLKELDIKGGCLGCCNCGPDNICAYDGKDGYREFFETKVLTADILVIAGAIHDRYLSYQIKRFFDRSFLKTHQPIYKDKQMIWLVSGPLSQISNLRQIMEAYPDVVGANLAGIITDECADSAELDAQLDGLAVKAVRLSENEYIAPQTFLGVGGMKIFRDDLFVDLRVTFQADYRYFKKNKLFNFPTKRLGMRAVFFLADLITQIPPIRKGFRKMMKEGMIMPFQKVVKAKSA